MKFHVLRHVPFEGLGAIEGWLQHNHHNYEYTHLYQSDCRLPALEQFDGLIVMGGPMGVYETAEHPWLNDEMRFIGQCIDAGKPVLGICLGAQLIATVLGADVQKNTHQEIGWFPMELTSAGAVHPLMTGFNAQTTVLHWHGDTFDIPVGATHLCASEACANQGYVYQERVIGLQFHLEMRRADIQRLINHADFAELDGTYVQSAEDIMAHVDHYEPACERLLDAMLNRWLTR